MPVDKEGNRADVITESLSIISRVNPDRLYQTYYNSASKTITLYIRNLIANSVSDLSLKEYRQLINNLLQVNPAVVEKAWQYLNKYYSMVSSVMHEGFAPIVGMYDDEIALNHLAEVCHDGVYLFIQTNNERDPVETVTLVEQHFKPTFGPVTYVDLNGRKVTTKSNIRIGSMYIIELEKIADTGMAAGSCKRSHFGVIQPNSNADKNSNPTKQQAVRGLGEAEVRIILSYAGPRAVVELLDRNNNYITHKHMLKNIFAADKPTNIDKIVDRNVQPYGGSKPLAYVNHILACAGIKFVYKPFEPFIGEY